MIAVKKFWHKGNFWLLTLGLVSVTSAMLFCSGISDKNKRDNLNREGGIVDQWGSIHVSGNQIIAWNGAPVILRGMSLFWSQWMGKYYTYDCIKWLRDDWNCTVIRAALGIGKDGYLENPAVEMKKIRTVIEACLDLRIYIIVDWHDYNAHNHQNQAIAFFEMIAKEYGQRPNIIYEIYNEPENVSWTEVIKPYADSVIQKIRLIDGDNLILVGTPTWSQDVDIASQNPLPFNNIAYTLHFYASTHRQALRDKATSALHNGMALFVSEFGTCEYTGTGIIDRQELENWFNFMQQNNISWCNWSIADKNETSAALKSGASARGGWTHNDLSESGLIIRDKIKLMNGPLFKLPAY
jgi:endoglucanase